MNSARIKTLVVVVFVLTLGAGVVAGLLASRLPGTRTDKTPITPSIGDAPLSEELGLSDEQRKMMKPIWEEVRTLNDACLRDSRKAQAERDEKIFKLIPNSKDKSDQEKIDEYNKIKGEYDNTVATFEGRRQKAFDDAVKKTEAILTQPQREKYEKILAKRLGAEFRGAHDANQ